MIKYSSTPNAFNAIRSAIAAVLPVTMDSGWQDTVIAVSEVLTTVWSIIPYGDSDSCKKLRKNLLADISAYIHGEEVRTDIMKKIVKSCANYSREVTLQIMFSVADSPKFLMYKEQDLHKMADNIDTYRSEINAITYIDKDGKRICPYDKEVYHNMYDLRGTIMRQSESISKFLIDNSESDAEAQFYKDNFIPLRNKALQYLADLPGLITGYQDGLYTPTVLEKEWFDSVLYARKHILQCEKAMEEYATGNAKKEMFSLSESKAPISSDEYVMRILHQLGWNKASCPAVLSNIFYPESLKVLGLEKQDGQISVDTDVYFAPAPGLGPGFKVRWVYSIDTNVNNYLTPLADLLQRADKLNDPNEAYNDQLTYLLENLQDISDAFCIDSTGYSDYLWKGIYVYLMELYGMSWNHVTRVMNCFSLPVKIDKELVPVEFGTFQGCKLLVFIMNHANRLMGLISDKLSGAAHICIRPNAGDDVIKASLDSAFCEADIFTEMLVFALFNSPTNSLKTAWLKRDGYVDFCSKYFAFVDNSLKCVSGVPAKKYGKEIVCVADWAETFKVLHSSGQNHTNCYDSFQLALPYIRQGLEEGCRLPNIYNIKMSLKGKIEQAANIPFTYGGLAEHDEEQDLDKLINTLKYKASLLLSSYIYEPIGVFLVVNRIEDLKDTELVKAIGSVSHQAVVDLVKLIRLLANPGAMSYEDFEWAKESIARFERNSINGQSISRTSSTYHRIERNKDVDLLFPIGAINADIGMPLPDDNVSALLMVSLLTDHAYIDIDNMRRYITAMKAVQANPGCIVSYHGIGYSTYYAVRDPDNNKLIRIYNNDDERYPDFEPIYKCRNQEVRNLAQMLRDCHASDYINIFYGIGDHVSQYQIDEMARKLLKEKARHMTEAAIKAILRKAVDNIISK